MKMVMKMFAGHKFIFASILALTMFGAVYGFAATLNFNTNTLSAGNQIVGSCDSAGAAVVKYTTAYDATSSGYKVTGVNITGLDTACNGKTISVELTGSGTNLPNALTSGAVAAGAYSAGAPGTTVLTKDVTGVSLALNG